MGFAPICGVCIGTCSAMPRSYFARLVPLGKEAEYMGLYKAASKITSWSGVLLFGLLSDVYDDLRVGVLAMSSFFFISAVFLFMIPADSRRFRDSPTDVELATDVEPSDDAERD